MYVSWSLDYQVWTFRSIGQRCRAKSRRHWPRKANCGKSDKNRRLLHTQAPRRRLSRREAKATHLLSAMQWCNDRPLFLVAQCTNLNKNEKVWEAENGKDLDPSRRTTVSYGTKGSDAILRWRGIIQLKESVKCFVLKNCDLFRFRPADTEINVFK